METKKCAIFIFDRYADWEPALAIAGLRTYGGYQVDSFSLMGESIISMGGLQVLPARKMSEISAEDYDLLILPGGEAWEQGGNEEITPLISEFYRAGKLVAAICGATVLLAKEGLLNTVPHTSNMPGYLKENAATYQGESFYQLKPCVRHENLLTANGAGMIEFAHEIFRACGIFDEATLEKVQILYKSGGMENRLFELTK